MTHDPELVQKVADAILHKQSKIAFPGELATAALDVIVPVVRGQERVTSVEHWITMLIHAKKHGSDQLVSYHESIDMLIQIMRDQLTEWEQPND